MSKWMVNSNFIGVWIYQVFRILDEKKVDHSGNREYYHQIFDSKEEAQEMADKLNRRINYDYRKSNEYLYK